MTGYHLSRRWFDWAFENPDINTPVHTALFMWVIEKWNRLGQKEKFGLPTTEAMEVLGINSFNTYRKVFAHLVEWGFIEVIQTSKNQYTATIIALSKSDKATVGALDKALTKQSGKQIRSTRRGIDGVDKQENEGVDQSINQDVMDSVETDAPDAEHEVDFDTMNVSVSINFQTVWDVYDKKIGDRHRCEKKWNALSDKEKWLAWQHIPEYVQSTPEKKYRANLETYLNQKRWNNEIIKTYGKSGNKATSASTAKARPFLEKPRAIGGDPVRKNIFGKEEKCG